ncbi:ligand-binding sensor domain-containing protein [Niabella drilacis]|uniref:histidine kinase n=1 Tax=Niabella drilacis (strain DSM 25811 / CCM 8410 / CCUG 62505 / LMG 26954 / E90) TaxID=1285928 RepID=A0A1G6XWX1_NIADE|nr:two-component regulator propeller domain-containing protein [Niabella drilacis]SDD82481.1 Two component regulator propeller [Niabella drilacis]
MKINNKTGPGWVIFIEGFVMTKLLLRTCFLLLFCLALKTAETQRLPFENFSVDKGLSQSQVTSITQDKRNYLWVGTLAGLNRFDGTGFRIFSKKDGLLSGHITALYTARNGDIWMATPKGISRYNGYRFEHFEAPSPAHFMCNTITEDEDGTLYAFGIMQGLFVVRHGKLEKYELPGNQKRITCLYRNDSGILLAYIYSEGLFRLRQGKWSKWLAVAGLENGEFLFRIAEQDGSYWTITNKGTLLKITGNAVVQKKQFPGARFTTLTTGDAGTLWLGTVKGAWMIDMQSWAVKRRINATNGVSDNGIHALYRDKDDIIWIGSDGDGLYKYASGPFVRYDKTSGLTGNVVMGFAKDREGNLFLGTREGKLFCYDSRKESFRNIDYSGYSTAGVNCLGIDGSNHLYVGTMDGRLLKIRGNQVTELFLEKKQHIPIYTIRPYDNRMLIHTTEGGYWVEGNKVQKLAGLPRGVVSSVLLNDTLLIGTTTGIYKCSADDRPVPLHIPVLEGINVSCFEKLGRYLVVGCVDEGLFFVDTVSNKVLPFNTDNGLIDNNVFAMLKDSRGLLWVGTSLGVQQVHFEAATGGFQIKKYTIADGYEPSETNLNAILEDDRHQIWVGTTKGAFLYNPVQEKERPGSKPFIVLEAAVFPGAGEAPGHRVSAWEQLPVQPQIAYAGNSIAFNFKGIYLKDPSSLRYAYQLYGYDTAFSLPQEQVALSYKNLQPGSYVFRVKAVTKSGQESSNTIEYPFTITTPYYKTAWFKGLMVLALVLAGGGIQLIYTNEKRRRRKEIRQIKELEQQKIREQTAEDFHDELGNKLTRISLLADLLQQKTDPADEEKNKLIGQIRSNALGLYTGTKEIIWSLTKESDHLKEVLQTIKQTGMELFSDTDIVFELTGFSAYEPDIRIPPGYNRNIIMIFKELLSNSMRHSGATLVTIECKQEQAGTMGIYFTDNGTGFDKNGVTGNGLNNIRRRAEKIGGSFTLNTASRQGTRACLTFGIQEQKNKKHNI